MVSVMRQGRMVATLPTAETNPEQLAEQMVGRKVLLRLEKKPATAGPVVLEVEDLRVVDDKGVERLKGIDLKVHAGEILGIAGVAGNGQSELLQVLGGYASATGSMRMNGVSLPLSGAGADGQARRGAGIAHVPEDRQREGLVMNFTAWENTIFGYQRAPDICPGPLMNNGVIIRAAQQMMQHFDVRPLNHGLSARHFSGGNQQKIALARELDRSPELLLVGQPTRGVDIGAIEFIHQRLIALRDQGKGILLVSVELEEILSLADRVVVMFDGRIMGERLTAQTNEQDLGLLMAGVGEGGP